MEGDTFLEHYQIAKRGDGTAEHLSQANGAAVYRAVDVRSKEPVELKLFPLSAVDPLARSDFEERARAAVLLDHINIEKVHAFGTQGDQYALVTEYLEGETVEDWIKEHGPMPPAAVLRIALQVVSALGAASFHNVRHRAIQPSNLGIIAGQPAEGGWPFVKLLNFAAPGPDGFQRQQNPVMLPFASPEQLAGGVIDFRSEVYSLGATMFFLLTAIVLPMESATAQPVIAQIRSRQLRRFPKTLRRLLDHMLQTDPEKRPQDPALLSEQIRECLIQVERRETLAHKFGVPILPVRATAIQDRPRRRGWLAGLAVAALLLGLGTLAALLLPEDVVTRALHRNRVPKTVGVPIGVPDTAAIASARSSPATTAAAALKPPIPPNEAERSRETTVAAKTQPSAAPKVDITPATVANNVNNAASPPEQQPPAPAAQPSPTLSAENGTIAQVAEVSPPPKNEATPPAENEGTDKSSTQPQIVANNPPPEPPPPPAEGPENAVPRAELVEGPPASANGNEVSEPESDEGVHHSESGAANSADSSIATASSQARNKTAGNKTKTTHRSASVTKRTRVVQTPPYERTRRTTRNGTMRARVVGTTPGGNLILRLPSGEIAFVRPRANEEYHPPNRRVIIERAAPVAPGPPLQPFRLEPDED